MMVVSPIRFSVACAGVPPRGPKSKQTDNFMKGLLPRAFKHSFLNSRLCDVVSYLFGGLLVLPVIVG